MRTSTRIGGVAAAAIFLAGAGWEVIRIATDQPWPGFVDSASDALGVVFIVLWAASAIVALLGTRRLAVISILGAFACLPHFWIARTGSAPEGILYLIAAPTLAVVLWLAFGSRLRFGEPGTEDARRGPPPRRSSGAAI